MKTLPRLVILPCNATAFYRSLDLKIIFASKGVDTVKVGDLSVTFGWNGSAFRRYALQPVPSQFKRERQAVGFDEDILAT